MKNWIKKVTGIADLEVAAQVATDTRISEEKRISALLVQQGKNLEEATAATAKAKLAAQEEIAAAKLAAQEANEAAELAAQEANEAAELAKMSIKDRATANGEIWVNVLDIHINQDDIRNGFFELDWNDLFVTDLVLNGYGTKDDPEEEVVDRWFKEIVSQMLSDEGLDPRRSSGYINVTPLSKGKSEIS
jgi:hypothetical protein